MAILQLFPILFDNEFHGNTMSGFTLFLDFNCQKRYIVIHQVPCLNYGQD